MWQDREDGVAVLLILDLHGSMEVERHIQARRDIQRLIDVPGTSPPDIEFLQTDDVRLAFSDHRSNAVDIKTTVRADAAVNIVSDDAWHVRRTIACPSAKSRFGRSVARRPQGDARGRKGRYRVTSLHACNQRVASDLQCSRRQVRSQLRGGNDPHAALRVGHIEQHDSLLRSDQAAGMTVNPQFG